MQDSNSKPTIFGDAVSALVWGIAAIKLVIFASFVVVLAQGSTTFAEVNSAQKTEDKLPPVVCTGKNLLDDLKTSNPQALAEMEKAALEVPNGNSRFWKIEKPGLAPSWLLGTMHFSDPRVATFTPEMEAAFNASDIVIIENTQVLDKKAVAKAMAELRSLMYLTDGSTLETLVDSETIKLLKARLKGRELPYFLGKRMQPWVVATAIVIPFCEVERKRRNKQVLDIIIGKRARQEGKQLIGLESVREQISAMAGLPLEFHLKSLAETVKLGNKIDDMMETMIELYQKGNIGKFWPLMEYLSPDTVKGKGYAAFQEVMIVKRNATMVERSSSQLEKGGVFMAVGALHLPGKLGILRRLQNAGYTVTPAL